MTFPAKQTAYRRVEDQVLDLFWSGYNHLARKDLVILAAYPLTAVIAAIMAAYGLAQIKRFRLQLESF